MNFLPKIRPIIIGVSLTLAIFTAHSYFNVFDLSISFAQEEEQDEEKVSELQEKINELEDKLKSIKSEKSTLKNEIESLNSQINLTQLKIQQSQQQIVQRQQEIESLQEDIEDLKNRINKLVDSIKYQEEILNTRARERYQSYDYTPFLMWFGADSFNEMISKTQYLQTLELQDQKLLAQMNSTKDAYKNQKDAFEDAKAREETLKNQLEAEKRQLQAFNNDLAAKKSQKDVLLRTTQNDEQKYQELLEEVKKELSQITQAARVLSGTDGEKVNKGDIIGYQGNTGFSTGEHLHFGVYRYSSFSDIDGWNWYYSNHVDPKKKLDNKSVYWNTGCEGAGSRSTGSGDWRWPINSPTLSQNYGYTCYSAIYYGGKVHPALDMYGNYGTPVYATEDGTAYFCRNCLGDGGNGVFIFHDDNYMSLYWHLR